MALEYWEMRKRQKGQVSAAELGKTLREQFGDEESEKEHYNPQATSTDSILEQCSKLPRQDILELIQGLNRIYQAESEYRTVSQTAIQLDRTTSRIRQLIFEGTLPAIKQGKIWLIPSDYIKNYTPPGQGKKSTRPRFK